MTRRYKVLYGEWKDKVVFKKELTEEQADVYHPPASMGFVCVYDSDGSYLGWCGKSWFKEHTSPWLNG